VSIDTTNAELADAELASHLAEEAGRRLLEIRAKLGFADGPALKLRRPYVWRVSALGQSGKPLPDVRWGMITS